MITLRRDLYCAGLSVMLRRRSAAEAGLQRTVFNSASSHT